MSDHFLLNALKKPFCLLGPYSLTLTDLCIVHSYKQKAFQIFILFKAWLSIVSYTHTHPHTHFS